MQRNAWRLNGIMQSILLIVFTAFGSASFAQKHMLNIVVIDSVESGKKIHPFNNEFFDVLNAKEGLMQLKQTMYKQGFLACSVDSLLFDSTQLTAFMFIGPQMKWINLRPGSFPVDWMQELNLNFNAYSGETLYPESFEKLVKRILTFAENHGYPFAEVGLDSIEFPSESGMMASLKLNKSRFFEMDSLTITGDAQISKSFLYSYLGFKPGSAYNESLILKMQSRLQRLPFLQPNLKRQIYFTGNKVAIHLDLKERKTDQIDGIIGFAPTSSTDTKLLITGEANIDLKNIFKRGIGYDLHWKSFQQRSQQLRMSTSYPYLFQTPIGVDAAFEYVKFDTLFYTLQTNLGLRYLFDGTNFVKFYLQNKSSDLIFADTVSVRSRKQMPGSNPVTSRSYGIELQLQKLDFVNNPRKGYRIHLDANVGSRNILKDIRVEQVLFYNSEKKAFTVYDSVKLKSVQGAFSYGLDWFLPIKEKSTLLTSISGKHILAENIFFNDLYRLGGTRSLRGFNEESLLTNSYTMASVEFRYLFSDNSFFQLFANGAYTEKKLEGITTYDWPIGFGTGVSLEVKSGLLTLAYAVGREQGNPIQLSNARIHFGIINFL